MKHELRRLAEAVQYVTAIAAYASYAIKIILDNENFRGSLCILRCPSPRRCGTYRGHGAAPARLRVDEYIRGY
jgi:hypothetical protein